MSSRKTERKSQKRAKQNFVNFKILYKVKPLAIFK